MVGLTEDNPTPLGGPTLDRLLARGWEFDFFPAVRLLQRSVNSVADIGERGPLAAEAIRFRPQVSVGFPATEVGRIAARPADDGSTRYGLDVTFMGLYGVSTPLPLHYAIDLLRSVDPYVPADGETGKSEQRSLADRDKPGDSNATRDFYDIFHHRLISLFYRSWTKYRYYITFDDPDRDRVTEYLLRMIGIPPGCETDSIGVDPVKMIRYAGALTQHPRSAVMLEGVVSDYIDGIETHVDQFSSRWVPVPEEDQNRSGVVNSRLGVDLTVGDWVYDLSGAFNLAIGPLDWETYKRFLPGRRAHTEVRSLVRLYCQDPLWFTMELRIKPLEIPELRLTSDEEAGMLGMTSWVRTAEIMEASVAFEESSMMCARAARRRTLYSMRRSERDAASLAIPPDKSVE